MTTAAGMASDEWRRRLDLESVAPDAFHGWSPKSGRSRVYGGLVLAQALMAMGRTVEARPAHSLHGYFIRAGDPTRPIAYEVERLRDGRSFSTRRCTASQDGVPIFSASASFHAAEPDGFDHAATMPQVPGPEGLPSWSDVEEGRWGDLPVQVRAGLGRDHPIDIRPVDHGRSLRRSDGAGLQSMWMRALGTLSADSALHNAALAYMSDMTLLDTALVPHGRSVFDDDVQAASLDHAIWFHRPFRADDWLLYVAEAPSAHGGRGFTQGALFSRGGDLVASVAQEGLIRGRLRSEGPPP